MFLWICLCNFDCAVLCYCNKFWILYDLIFICDLFLEFVLIFLKFFMSVYLIMQIFDLFIYAKKMDNWSSLCNWNGLLCIIFPAYMYNLKICVTYISMSVSCDIHDFVCHSLLSSDGNAFPKEKLKEEKPHCWCWTWKSKCGTNSISSI